MALPSGPNFEFHADRPVVMNIDLNELFSVRNRSVVITGGASGIGFAVASTLTDRGANVTLLDRDRQKLESAVQNHRTAAIRSRGITTLALTTAEPRSAI